MTDQQHCSEVYDLDGGETVTLALSDGHEIEATVTDRSVHNDETGPNITEQTTVEFERADDGSGMRLTMINGLYGAGPPEDSPFPSHIPLLDTEGVQSGEPVPDEHKYGYVADVER